MSAAGAVLITGCSSGIGRSTAEHLARRGHTVYATARRRDSLAELEHAGCRTLALDGLDEGSMRAAVDTIESAHGAVGPYAGYHGAVAKADAETDESFMAGDPSQVARAIERALTAARPRPRYRVTPISHVLPKMRGVLGDRGFDAFLRTPIKAPSQDA